MARPEKQKMLEKQLHLEKRSGRTKFKAMNPTVGNVWIKMLQTFASGS